MPIIVWGSRGLTSTLDRGQFYCPACEGSCGYQLMQTRPFFTLYFIPLFPIGGGQRFVECDRCGGKFVEGVLEMKAPPAGKTDAEQQVNDIYEQLREGISTEEAETLLVNMVGLPRERAEAIVREMTDGDTWRCQICAQHYLKSVKKCTRCNE